MSKLYSPGELTSPLILLTGLEEWDKVRVDLQKKKRLLSRHLPQARSLNRLQGKQGCFPPPSDKGRKWLLQTQNSEDSGGSSFYPSKCSHPRSSLSESLFFRRNLSHLCTQSPFSSITSVPLWLYHLSPPLALSHKHDFQHAWKSALWLHKKRTSLSAAMKALWIWCLTLSWQMAELSLLFAFLEISAASAQSFKLSIPSHHSGARATTLPFTYPTS